MYKYIKNLASARNWLAGAAMTLAIVSGGLSFSVEATASHALDMKRKADIDWVGYHAAMAVDEPSRTAVLAQYGNGLLAGDLFERFSDELAEAIDVEVRASRLATERTACYAGTALLFALWLSSSVSALRRTRPTGTV